MQPTRWGGEGRDAASRAAKESRTAARPAASRVTVRMLKHVLRRSPPRARWSGVVRCGTANMAVLALGRTAEVGCGGSDIVARHPLARPSSRGEWKRRHGFVACPSAAEMGADELEVRDRPGDRRAVVGVGE